MNTSHCTQNSSQLVIEFVGEFHNRCKLLATSDFRKTWSTEFTNGAM